MPQQGGISRIGVNVRFNRGFRRGEGSWVDGWWAIMVARGGSPGDAVLVMIGPRPPSTGDHKGPPFPTSSALAPTGGDELFSG